MQAIGDMRDGILSAQRCLEHAGAVAVPTLLIGPCAGTACGEFHTLDTLYHVPRFHAIGTDILYRRCAHLSGDEREVLQPVPPIGHSL